MVGDGIRIRLRSAVRYRECRVKQRRKGVPPRRANGNGNGNGSGGRGRTDRSWPGTRGVRLPLRDGATRLRVPKLDRLEERGGDGQAVPPGGRKAQPARTREGRRVERGVAARF